MPSAHGLTQGARRSLRGAVIREGGFCSTGHSDSPTFTETLSEPPAARDNSRYRAMA